MAIQLDLETSNYGIPFKAAYFRIISVGVSRHRSNFFGVMIELTGYATIPDDTTFIRDIATRSYCAPMEEIDAQLSDLFLTKCYQWVMSQEDMLGSIAV